MKKKREMIAKRNKQFGISSDELREHWKSYGFQVPNVEYDKINESGWKTMDEQVTRQAGEVKMRAPRKCISSYQCKSGLGKG